MRKYVNPAYYFEMYYKSVSAALADEVEILLSQSSFTRFLSDFRQMKDEPLIIIYPLENHRKIEQKFLKIEEENEHH